MLFRSQRDRRAVIHTELKELTKRAYDIETRRNQIIHSIWSGLIEEPVAMRMKKTAKGKLQWQTEELRTSDLNDFSNSIATLIKDLESFMRMQSYDFLKEEIRLK